MSDVAKALFGFITLIAGLAILSVLVAKRGHAPALIQNISAAIALSIKAATGS